MKQESQEWRNNYLDLAGIENYNVTSLQQLAELETEESPRKRHHRHRHKMKHSHSRDACREKDRDYKLKDETKDKDVTVEPVTGIVPPYHYVEDMAECLAEQTVDPTRENGPGLDSNFMGPEGVIGEVPPLETPPPPPRMRPMSLPPQGLSPTTLPEIMSPHHHRRHRHRERNRRLAMQQVAEWIEREHPSWGGMLEELTVDGPDVTNAQPVTPQNIIIERHEHHHIHEHHHHHHYHYYQDS